MCALREAAAACHSNGTIYVCGGSHRGTPWRTAECLTLLSSAANTEWTALPDMHVARDAACAAALNGAVYMIGGFDGMHWLDSVERYDPACKQWTLLPDRMAQPRNSFACCVYRNEIYVVGGYQGEGRYPREVEVFSPVSGRWTVVSHLPEGRNARALFVLQDRLYVLGGNDPSHGAIHKSHFVGAGFVCRE
jgi:N-acetylneuraminic acid mutarotase